ncbi:MAG: hypothetical protein K0S23_359 [Fluviicola sp.]|jgi:hypothetical protein|uniref:hypothetical protein n=1 Tax=Fluviicola sp. TaxID=1917219 RepID=UPI002622367C|nr:hypothetical protein [Fluviicola sp.]MDF3026052.1 hypothetical protein [Fluviicola sp.]
MESTELDELELFLGKEMLLLNLKGNILRKASRNFNITTDEAEARYLIVRTKIKKQAGRRAWTYLLIGSVFLGVGLIGTFSKTGFIFIGALLAGTACTLTAFGLFRLSVRK